MQRIYSFQYNLLNHPGPSLVLLKNTRLPICSSLQSAILRGTWLSNALLKVHFESTQSLNIPTCGDIQFLKCEHISTIQGKNYRENINYYQSTHHTTIFWNNQLLWSTPLVLLKVKQRNHGWWMAFQVFNILWWTWNPVKSLDQHLSNYLQEQNQNGSWHGITVQFWLIPDLTSRT